MLRALIAILNESRKQIMIIPFFLALLGTGTSLWTNGYEKSSTADRIFDSEQAAELIDVDHILFLGYFVKETG